MMRSYFKLLTVIFLLATTKNQAQVISSGLCHPDVISFSGAYYAIGYEEKDKGLFAVIRIVSEQAATLKEKSISLGKKTCASVYSMQADTLHGYLNLLIQDVDNDKTARVIRLDKQLNLVADLPDAEITRVNTFTAYDKEFLYEGNNLYVVRPFSKDSINHFFLQKYTLKDSSKIFEYNTGWQISFGKQQYHRCHIMRADSQYVYLFVNVIRGGRQGQWVMFIDARKGEILHAERLNDENEDYTFLYGANAYNSQTREFCVAGYRIKKSNVNSDYSSIHFSLTGLKAAPVFVCTFDSSGFILEKAKDFVTIPPDISREKEFKEYVYKIHKIAYFNNRYNFLFEMLGGNPNNKAFKTYGFQYTVLEHNEEKILKPSANNFICTYRDSKIKDAKNIFNLHELDTKQNADAFLYSSAVSGPFKAFDWMLSFAGDQISGYSVYSGKSSTTLYSYQLKENKWQAAEMDKLNNPAFLKSFITHNGKLLCFINTDYNPETRISKGLEAKQLNFK